jgi:hypothetical protein
VIGKDLLWDLLAPPLQHAQLTRLQVVCSLPSLRFGQIQLTVHQHIHMLLPLLNPASFPSQQQPSAEQRTRLSSKDTAAHTII